MPLVSVCIPTYNGGTFLAEAVESVFAQTYTNLEIILSDDASVDNTIQIAELYQANSSFPFSIIHHQPSGIGANWNNCLNMAKGKYIKFLFQDDVLEKDCITEMVNEMENDANLGLVACKRNILVDQNALSQKTNTWIATYDDLQMNIDLERKETFRMTKQLFGLPHFFNPPLNNKIGEPSATLFSKDIINQVGFFNTQLKQILDYEYWYRILFVKDILIINKPLASFRIHEQQATNVNSRNKVNERKLWENILFKTYYPSLHPELQQQLQHKFAWHKRVLRTLKQSFTKSNNS